MTMPAPTPTRAGQKGLQGRNDMLPAKLAPAPSPRRRFFNVLTWRHAKRAPYPPPPPHCYPSILYVPHLACGADLLVDKKLVDIGPLVAGHLHHVSPLRIAHDGAVAAKD